MSIKSELCKDFAGEDGGKFVSHRAWHRVMHRASYRVMYQLG